MTMTYPTDTEQLAAALNLTVGGLKTRFFRAQKLGLVTPPFSQKELRADQVTALVSSLASDEANDEAETERLEKLETERLAKLETERLDKLETERLAKLETERLAKLETERLDKIHSDFLEQKKQRLETEFNNAKTPETHAQTIDRQPITAFVSGTGAAHIPAIETNELATETVRETEPTLETTPSVKYNKVPLGIFCFVMCLINLLVFVPKNWDAQPHIFTATFVICAIPCWMEYRFASILLAIETRNLSSSFLRLLRHQWMSLAVLVPAMLFQEFNLFELTWDVVKPDLNPNHGGLPYFMTVFQLYGLIETVNMQKK